MAARQHKKQHSYLSRLLPTHHALPPISYHRFLFFSILLFVIQ
ncbi:hypothetical protein BAT_0391 [Bacillus pumilus ATCC 7061]|nr:hypothetical protein BAT_0391 [Bacillus pumilus ATCC 7061]